MEKGKSCAWKDMESLAQTEFLDHSNKVRFYLKLMESFHKILFRRMQIT